MAVHKTTKLPKAVIIDWELCLVTNVMCNVQCLYVKIFYVQLHDHLHFYDKHLYNHTIYSTVIQFRVHFVNIVSYYLIILNSI